MIDPDTAATPNAWKVMPPRADPTQWVEVARSVRA
jgi:hypothetical protein